MKNHNTAVKKTAGPATPSRWHRSRFRRKAPSEVTVKGQLRMRSPSGAFVMVGVSVVLVGMTIAVIGYWPHRTKSGGVGRPGNSSATSDIKKEVRVSPHIRSFPHSEKLKLIGPVIMGIGLFIFICANTMLYENRDMETRLLMQKELYSMSLRLPRDPSEASSYLQRRPLPSTLQANAECVEGCYEVDFSSSGFQSCSSPASKWANHCDSNRLQANAHLLHHKNGSPSLSLLSVHSNSGNSVTPDNYSLSFPHGAESAISSAVSALSLPFIKLNTCLLENQGISQTAPQDLEGSCVRLLEEKEEMLRHPWTLQPGHSSVVPKTDTFKSNHIIIDMISQPSTGTSAEKLLCPEGTKREFGSDVQVPSSGHSKSLDLGQPGKVSVAPSKDRKHRSWPRLDHIGLVNYAKLESRGDSSDRLLEPTREPTRGESLQSFQEVVIAISSGV
uniref:Transmembrane protein 200B n=1 Tax=Salvator merianae TaxID=96440 RepID=A0A8D0BC33_SALMN